MTSYVYSWDAEIWTTEKTTTDQYPNYSILSISPQIFNNNIWFKPFSFWFFVRSWVSIILRDFMQNTNNFQADTTFFRTSDNLFEIKTHYTLKNTVFFYRTIFLHSVMNINKTLKIKSMKKHWVWTQTSAIISKS